MKLETDRHRTIYEAIKAGIEVLPKASHGARLALAYAFGSPVPFRIDRLGDVAESMARPGFDELCDWRVVLDGIELNDCFYNPGTGIAIDAFVADCDDPEIVIRQVGLDQVRAARDLGVEFFDLIFTESAPAIVYSDIATIPYDEGHKPALESMARAIATDGRWICATGLQIDLIERCEQIVRRCDRIERGVGDLRLEPAEKRDRGEPSAGNPQGPVGEPETDRGELWRFLGRALDEFRGKGGWRGLDAESGIEAFVRFVGSGECTVPLPQAATRPANARPEAGHQPAARSRRHL